MSTISFRPAILVPVALVAGLALPLAALAEVKPKPRPESVEAAADSAPDTSPEVVSEAPANTEAATEAMPEILTTGGPQSSVQITRYTCARGIEVPATYVNAPDLSLVVLNVEGQQITLYAEISGSGARYGWPSDGANYVWWSKGKEATLYWSEAGEDTPLLADCAEKG